MKLFASPKVDQSAGFTLIEVLVVVVIAAVLAAIAAPSWQGFLNRQRVSAVKSDLLQTLKNAQQDAIQRRLSVPIVINDAATLPTVTVNGNAQVLGSNNNNPSNVRLRSYSVGNTGTQDATFDTIVFDHRGMPTIGRSTTTAIPNSDVLPFVISINAQNATTKQCVIVASLLGSLKTASNAQCDNPSVAVN
ncbi:prepilin-type N-terminal cleavage/methylation domain-containing protein [Nodosilinea sp. PGN35]|uniref:prepilin-type N-terminal cleavage/methylation domain-containing protein n=1 Tax=Nodosilinea sp. PGN35 TaxID=3020489 RepID=UPI0023B2953A|nr:prepilin-type N-terminal cleavage/methylation domain-containing protein [Nodosilinea sp. TSF1-S3]MDF0370177.1 prepilin-type N-terminal cleavage/methylation domain-containing protein [Nodosilinea sp. TSF1-S3]